VTHATLQRFAEVNDAAAATNKKLQKQAILADYFRGLGDEADLRPAVRFAGGRVFASTDERVLNVGGALMREAIVELIDIDLPELGTLTIKAGEIGEAMAAVWESRRRPRREPLPPPGKPTPRVAPAEVPLTLRAVAAAFDDIAKVGKRESKLAALVDLLALARTSRQAAYLGKIVFGDLRTGVQEGVLQAAVALAFDVPLAKVQRCQLLVGDLDEVAILAKRGEIDSARFRLFHPIQFMLATPQESAADVAGTLAGRAYVAEDKLDGIRAQVHKAGGTGEAARVAIYTRTMDRADESFPDVVEQVSKLPGDVLLDGEIVPYANGQVLPFGQLQKRLGRKSPPVAVVRDNPCAFVAFDVLYQDGRLLMDEPLTARRPALEAACAAAGVPTLPQTPVTTQAEIEAIFGAARDRRNEGIILKDPASAYAPGRRGKIWLKLKTHLPTLDCVVTAAETGHGKRRNSLSDYTFAVWDGEPAAAEPAAVAEAGVVVDTGPAAGPATPAVAGKGDRAAGAAKLVNIGKAFSGVTDEEIAKLTTLFTELTVAQFGRVRQVTPQVVLEIAFDQIQKSGRHASGYALRFPRIKRVRWDKRPEDADRLARVAEIYASTPNFARPTGGGADADAGIDGGGGGGRAGTRPGAGDKPRGGTRRGRGKPSADDGPSLFDPA
jgi:DNA ligase-1